MEDEEVYKDRIRTLLQSLTGINICLKASLNACRLEVDKRLDTCTIDLATKTKPVLMEMAKVCSTYI